MEHVLHANEKPKITQKIRRLHCSHNFQVELHVRNRGHTIKIMILTRQVLHMRQPILRCAQRAFVAETQSGVGRDKLRSKAASHNAAAVLLAVAAVGALTASTVTLMEESKYRSRPAQKYESPRSIPVKGAESHHADYNDPPTRPDLPIIPLEEVREHVDEDSMWFTFRGAVYDLTFFKYGHPGGTPVSDL